MPESLRLESLRGIPMVSADANLAQLLDEALSRLSQPPVAGDILVVAQKIVSKAENRFVDLAALKPSARALEVAEVTGHSPNFVECVLRESRRVVRYAPHVLIVEHKLGFVHANAGVDRSNVEGEDQALLLPEDPDASAAALCEALTARLGFALPIIVNDSLGRAWRTGVVGMALGCAGMAPLQSHVGESDLFGRPLEVTEVALADELAAAASLLMGPGAEGRPAVLARGVTPPPPTDGGVRSSLLRRREQDLFR